MGAVTVGMLGPEGGAVAGITEVVNRAYAIGEKGLWREGATRTTPAEVEVFARNGEIAVARLDERIVGSVRIQQFDGGVGEFGMLAADPGLQGLGIGRELVEFAEGLSRERGLGIMQLELLTPKTWVHPTKKFLHEWYTRVGYRIVRTGNIEERYPALAPLLATPCDFVIYQRPLKRG